MIKGYKYRIYPTKVQAERLQWVLDRCRELYNAALQERKEAYKYAGKSISRYEQSQSLTDIRNNDRPEYQAICRTVLTDVLMRLEKAYQSFFRRIKNGEAPGYPRFQGKNRYNSFTYTDDHGLVLQAGATPKKKTGKLTLSKFGTVNIRLHRPIEGKIKTITIKREGEHWYALFSCEVEQKIAYHPSEEAIGIDLGLLHFATLSDGSTIENPRHLRASEQKLKKLQATLSHKKRGSERRKRAAQLVGKTHRHIRNQRKDFHHKEACKLVKAYQTIAFEKLQPANMSKRPKPKKDENGKYLPNGASTKAGLNKSILDAGWGQFQQIVMNKAECAGSRVLFVNPKYTSQICSGCGAIVKKELSERWHSCSCGCELDRDHNAAINILRLSLNA